MAQDDQAAGQTVATDDDVKAVQRLTAATMTCEPGESLEMTIDKDDPHVARASLQNSRYRQANHSTTPHFRFSYPPKNDKMILGGYSSFPFLRTRPMIRDECLCGDDLIEAADTCLRQIAVRSVSCRYENGTLFLRGQVPSYYHKQRIQEAVIRLKGVTEVKNEIEVIRVRPR